MAASVKTSAITNLTEYPNSFKRQGAFPLERYSLFNSIEDAETYISSNPISYVGQIVVVAKPRKNSRWSVTGYANGIAFDHQTSKVYIVNSSGDEVYLGMIGDMSFPTAFVPDTVWNISGLVGDSAELNGKTATCTAATELAFTKAYIIGADQQLHELALGEEASAATSSVDDKVTAAGDVEMPTRSSVTLYGLYDAVEAIRAALAGSS